MYGKLFASIFEGSLYGQFDALVVMTALIALADKDGVIDMTPQALAARTSYPLEVVQRGLEHLAQPDPRSRSKEHEGRRIVLIDPERGWGWRLVNHAKYRGIRSQDDRAEYMRDYMAKRRAKGRRVNTGVSTSVNSVNSVLAPLAHTEAEAEAVNTLLFERVWKAYPKREGGNPKAKAAKACRARVAEGVQSETLLQATIRYAEYCKARGLVGTRHVMQASTFFGPDRRFEDDYQIAAPPSPAPRPRTDEI